MRMVRQCTASLKSVRWKSFKYATQVASIISVAVLLNIIQLWAILNKSIADKVKAYYKRIKEQREEDAREDSNTFSLP